LKTINASVVKKNFGAFINDAQKEETIILKNGTPILRVTPIRASKSELIDELFDWGISGLDENEILKGMMDKYYEH
jgi:antitoxin (DNA-binding transcriptional repressor) of toxin-antitoxin stability system